MKKIICKRVYNTDEASVIHRYTSGVYGDPAGYEEVLCKTPEGLYFLYVRGGAESPYPEEDILRLAKNKVKEWIRTH